VSYFPRSSRQLGSENFFRGNHWYKTFEQPSEAGAAPWLCLQAIQRGSELQVAFPPISLINDVITIDMM
jgi:hypothetical protein